jgi:hypothetical protein
MVAIKKSSLHRVKGKQIVAEKKTSAKPHAAPQSAVATIDRRGDGDRRTGADRRTHNIPVAVERRAIERRVKVTRRRQIDPTTCERDYSSDEIEFMGAMDDYKRRSGRMFPTCSEVLEVLKSLGYAKAAKIEAEVLPTFDLPVAATQSLMTTS